MSTEDVRERVISILRQHGKRAGMRDLRTHCLCGWESAGPNGPGEHIAHRADVLLSGLHGLSSTIAALARARETLEDFALRGSHLDTSPTLGGHLGDGRDPVAWSTYLRDGDLMVRDIAKRALADIDALLGGERP